MAVANASVASRQKNWRQFPFAVGASFRIERRHKLSTTQNRTQNAAGPKDIIPKDKSPNPTAFSVTDVDRSSPRSAKTTIPGGYPRRVSQQCGKYTSRAASSVFDVRERYETWHKSDCHVDISHPSTWALCIVSSRPPPVMGTSFLIHPSAFGRIGTFLARVCKCKSVHVFKTCGGCLGTTTLSYNKWVETK